VLGVEDGGEDLVDGHLEVAEARRQTVLEVEVAVQQVQQQIVTCAPYFIKFESINRHDNKKKRNGQSSTVDGLARRAHGLPDLSEPDGCFKFL
jgi:hypothetical protein